MYTCLNHTHLQSVWDYLQSEERIWNEITSDSCRDFCSWFKSINWQKTKNKDGGAPKDQPTVPDLRGSETPDSERE